MAAAYSVRFLDQRNFTGTLYETNGTGLRWVIRTVTVYYGSVPDATFFLVGPSGGAWLRYEWTLGAGPGSFIWPDVRLVINPGEILQVSTSAGMDFSAHGYQLSV